MDGRSAVSCWRRWSVRSALARPRTVAAHASWRLVFVGILPAMALGAAMLLPSLRRLTGTPSAPPNTAPSAVRQVVGSQRLGAALRLAAGVGLVLLAATLEFLPGTLVV